MDIFNLDKEKTIEGLKLWSGAIFRHSSDSLIDLLLTMLLMVIVERQSGYSGLGVYSYFLSLYVITRYFSGWGIARHVEVKLSAMEHDADEYGPLMLRAERSVLIASIFCALLLTVFALSGAMFTRIDESAAAYVMLGVAVVLYNYNHLRISALAGRGMNDIFLSVKFRRRIALFLTVVVLSGIGLPPSYFVLAFIFSEAVTSYSLRNAGFSLLYEGRVPLAEIRKTLQDGGKGLFVGDAIKFVLFADFFVLGLFVSSADLGLYAEATVLGRLLLLIPLSMRPVIRRRLSQVFASGGLGAMAEKLNSYIRYGFLFHSVAALMIALHFRGAVNFFFIESLGARLPHGVFLVLLPGFVAYSTLIMAVPAYELAGKVHLLRDIVMMTLGSNLALNLYMVPYAGIYGAATATSLSLLLYFLLFGKGIEKPLKAFKSPLVIAGLSAYLLYNLLKWMGTGFAFDILLVPAGIMLLYWFSGFFIGLRPIMTDPMAVKININGGVNE